MFRDGAARPRREAVRAAATRTADGRHRRARTRWRTRRRRRPRRRRGTRKRCAVDPRLLASSRLGGSARASSLVLRERYRHTRHRTPAQRRAYAALDGRPGCHRRRAHAAAGAAVLAHSPTAGDGHTLPIMAQAPKRDARERWASPHIYIYAPSHHHPRGVSRGGWRPRPRRTGRGPNVTAQRACGP